MNNIILIHGRSYKPRFKELQNLWCEAISHGLKRDFGAKSLKAFEDANLILVYYGDLSNTLLKVNDDDPPTLEALAKVRTETLKDLKILNSEAFLNESLYNKIKKKRNMLKRGLLKFASKTLDIFDKEDSGARIIGARKKDMKEFFDPSSDFGRNVRERMIQAAAEALKSGGRNIIISHSLGTVIAYDSLWSLSWESNSTLTKEHKIDTLMTLGSPLADETMKNKVFGADEQGQRKYPSNIRNWVNIAAKHDYIAVDSGVHNDYRGISKHHGTTVIDKKIFNLARREGESHPHSSLGYLIHPTFSKVLNNWLSTG